MNNNLFIKFSVIASLTLSSVIAANLDNGTYTIKSMHSGECLELDSSVSNSKLIQAKCVTDSEAQKFTVLNVENNTYTISSLAVGNSSLENGVHYFNSSSADEFILVEGSPTNSFSMKNTRSKKVVTLIPYTDEVIQYYDHGGKEQLWKFVGENDNSTIYASCKEILDAGKSIGDGTYTIDIDGNGESKPFEVYCDMITDGGGWTVYNFRNYSSYGDMANAPELVNYSTYDPLTGQTYHPEVSFSQNSSYGLRWGYNTPTYDGYLEYITFNTPVFNEIKIKGGLPVYQRDWGRLRVYAYDSIDKNNWLQIQLNVDKNTCHQWSSGMFWLSSINQTNNYELENGLSGGCRGIGIKEHYVYGKIDLNTIRLGLGGVHMSASRQTEAFIDYIKVR